MVVLLSWLGEAYGSAISYCNFLSEVEGADIRKRGSGLSSLYSVAPADRGINRH